MLRILISFLAVVLTVFAETEPLCNEFDPTCGSDGVLYSSICKLQQINYNNDVTAINWEDCQVDCDHMPCTREYYPRCGTDGNIYNNVCMLLRQSCGKSDKIYKQPLINCVEKMCPDDCEDSDTDCKDLVESCRDPWKAYL